MANTSGMLPMSMATRNVADVPGRPERHTEFQLYESLGPNVIDFTLHRLVKYMSTAKDAQQRLLLCALIDDYRNGDAAVAWKRGNPVAIRVTRDV